MTIPIRVELLGGCRVLAGKRAADRILTARQQELLAYLTLNRASLLSRHRVAGDLWPESTDAQALTNLRRELHHLRSELPEIEGLVRADSRTLAWNAGAAVELDVSEFERAVEDGLRGQRGPLEVASSLYRGDLLPQCDTEWIRPERERLRRLCAEALARLVELLEEDQATAEAIECAQRLLQLDTLREATWRALMRCHAMRGERATALHVYHRCASVLKQELGVQPSSETRLVYRELLEREESSAIAAPASPQTVVYPLIGRRAEFLALQASWQAAAAGRAQVALVRGEAGIGKTRLVEELVAWTRNRKLRSSTTRCYAGEGRLAYGPLIAWLQAEAFRAPLAALEPVWATEIARLHPDLVSGRADVLPPGPGPEHWQRPRLFDALSRVVGAAAPLLLVVDDLQWCDSDTLEWLHFFIRSSLDLRCLVVGTVRSEEEPDNEALGVFRRELERLDRLSLIAIGPLDEAATARLAEEVVEHPLDSELHARVFRRTEGHPLFIVESGRAGLAQSGPGAYDALPARVQAVVAARLTQLSPEAREVAELAAVVGRDFAFDVLAHAGDLEDAGIVRALDELWRRQIVRAHASDRWDFGHDRVREVAYGGIGPARRRLLHRRVAQALEQLFAPDLDQVSASIAAHFEQAGQPARALQFYQRAGQGAARVSANEEAIRCFSRALPLLDQVLTGREREAMELSIRGALSGVLTSARGYSAPEVEANLERVAALEAAQHPGEIPVRWLWGLWTTRFVLGDLESARALSTRAWRLVPDDPTCACEAHHALAATLTSLGELESAREHFDLAIAAYDERHPRQSALGSDLGVFTHAWYSHALWLLGCSARAASHAEEAIALANRLDHAYSQTVAHAYATVTYQLRREPAKVHANAEAVLTRCDRHGFAYYGDWARVLAGWAHSQEGRTAQGIELIERGLAGLDRQRAQARRPYYLSLLAEAHAAVGDIDRAVALVERAIEMATGCGDVWWLAELNRLIGEWAPPDLAHTWFQRALEIARSQCNRALELRAALSLAGRWQRDGRLEAASTLLAPLAATLPEADAADLSRAAAFVSTSS